jgi:predicted hydrolase (HD superfamily)
MNTEEALDFLHSHVQNINLRRHCYAVGYSMEGIYDFLEGRSLLEKVTAPEKEVWKVLGFIHDTDYEETKDDPSNHTILTLKWLKEFGMDESNPIYQAIQSHNSRHTKMNDPNTLMEWALECCDELTGFIVASALVMPDKKLSSVKVDSILRKWKQPSFARAVDRKQIEQCEEKLGIKLDELIRIVLKFMQLNSEKLGL